VPVDVAKVMCYYLHLRFMVGSVLGRGYGARPEKSSERAAYHWPSRRNCKKSGSSYLRDSPRPIYREGRLTLRIKVVHFPRCNNSNNNDDDNNNNNNNNNNNGWGGEGGENFQKRRREFLGRIMTER
jgi:hypothetical protein